MKPINSVLLIDDDNIFNFLNKKIIEYENFARKVSSQVNPGKALEELRQLYQSENEKFPEMIFLDINMPVMDGWEFLEEFEKFPENILEKCKVFILSSSIDPRDIEKSKTYKTVKDFISKPLSPEILHTLVSTQADDLKKESILTEIESDRINTKNPFIQAA
jgi:CheY-like chemotaxis protein